MKILILNKLDYPNLGGVETVAKQYAEWLESDGHDVTVFTTKNKSNFEIEYLTVNNVKVIKHSAFFRFGSMPISISYIVNFIFLFNKYDIIHFHEPFPIGSLLANLIKKKKIIITYHSDIIKQSGFLKTLSVFLLKRALRKAQIITTTSSRLLNSSDLLLKYKAKTKIIPLSSEKQSSTSFSPNSYFLLIGRLSYYKGVDVLIKALKNSNILNRKILIIGKGEKEIEHLISNFAKEKSNVTFINEFVSEKMKLDYIKNCYCLLFPSNFNSEAFGITQIESLSFAKPVINTNLDTGVPWVSLNNITGFTAKPGCAVSFSKCIEKMDNLSKDKYEFFCKNAKIRHKKLFENNVVKNQILDCSKS